MGLWLAGDTAPTDWLLRPSLTHSLASDGEEYLLVEVGHLLGYLQCAQRADRLLGGALQQQVHC